VFQLNGGTSSLFQATGGTVEVQGSGYNGWIGAGSLAGQWTGGALLKVPWGKSTVSFGDEIIPFCLPTDIFNSSHYFLGRGVGIATKWENLDLFGFAGTTSTGFDAPYFRGARSERGAGAFFIETKLSPSWSAFSRNIVSDQKTTISGLEWHPLPALRTAFSGGVGANHGYLGSSFSAEWQWVSIKAAYMLTGHQFHRVVVQTPIVSENDRENILLTLHPKRFLTLTAGRFNFLQSQQDTVPASRATVNQYSANLTADHFVLTGSLFKSYVQSMMTQGTAFSVGRHFARNFQATASLYHSRSGRNVRTTSLLAMLRENLSSRLSLLEMVNKANGHPTISFGGDFLSNIVSFGLNYQTVYLPFRTTNPFKQALVLNVSFHPFGSVQVSTGSYIAPDGSVKYTVSSSTFLYHGESARGSQRRFKFPKYIVRGVVVDQNGKPIEGASLRIGRDSIFTNSEGKFFMRTKKSRPVQLRVLLKDFLVPGHFRIMLFPRTVTPVKEGQEVECVIVLQRLRDNLVAHTKPI
jgi:hypothetical protein